MWIVWRFLTKYMLKSWRWCETLTERCLLRFLMRRCQLQVDLTLGSFSSGKCPTFVLVVVDQSGPGSTHQFLVSQRYFYKHSNYCNIYNYIGVSTFCHRILILFCLLSGLHCHWFYFPFFPEWTLNKCLQNVVICDYQGTSPWIYVFVTIFLILLMSCLSLYQMVLFHLVAWHIIYIPFVCTMYLTLFFASSFSL